MAATSASNSVIAWRMCRLPAFALPRFTLACCLKAAMTAVTRRALRVRRSRSSRAPRVSVVSGLKSLRFTDVALGCTANGRVNARKVTRRRQILVISATGTKIAAHSPRRELGDPDAPSRVCE